MCFSCGPPSLVVPVFVCRVSFFLWRQSCVFFLSSCWVWGRLLLSLFWCDCSAFFLGHLRFSAVCHAAGYPSRVPHLADSGWLTYSCSGRLAWVGGVLLHLLVFYLVPAQLPLPLLPLRGSAPCVRVLQLRWCLLGLKVRSPCCPSRTLGWVCFWPTVSQAFVGCEGGLGCPSWFVILFLCLFVFHLFWGWGGLVTGLWPLLRLLGFGLF